MLATGKIYWGVVKLLIENGANVNLQNKLGATALIFATAVYGDNDAMVKFLIDNGADIYKCFPPGKSVYAGKSMYDILCTDVKFQAQLERLARKALNQNESNTQSYYPYKRL